MKKLPTVPVRESFIRMSGGLDVTTPPLLASVESCRNSKNAYQDVNGGYSTHEGYERFDGRPSPSLALYATLVVTGLSGSVVTGAAITDGISTAVVAGIDGSILVITKISGAFSPGNILVGASVVGSISETQVDDGGATPALDAQYRYWAAEIYRNDISMPAGEGPTLGGKRHNGTLYVFRDNVGRTSAHLWKSTVSGWVEVPLGYELQFTSGGTFVPSEGDTIIGETSGATAVIERVVLETGDFSAGTAAGRFIFHVTTGVFVAETIKILANLNVASIGTSAVPITLLPGGSFEIVTGNFTGSVSTRRMYGVDGVNHGWEFDGTVFVPIHTGMTADAPVHVHIHVGHLVYSFSGSMQHSSPGFPYSWVVYLGAAEIGMGTEITGFSSQPGADGSPVMAIYSRNSISMLYGSGKDTWKLIPFRSEAGAVPRSSQVVGQTLLLDDMGITTLTATQAYGNFNYATISERVKSWLNPKINMLTCSCVVREKNLYCLFFSDGTAFYSTVALGKKGSSLVSAIMPIDLGRPVVWIDSTVDTDGREVIFFGDSTGMVYQMFKGRSFDGASIDWLIELHYNNLKTNNYDKKFRSTVVEMSGDSYAEFAFCYSLGNGSSDIEQPVVVACAAEMTTMDLEDMDLDSCFFDGEMLSSVRFQSPGSANNISYSLSGSSELSGKLSFSGLLVLYSITRSKR